MKVALLPGDGIGREVSAPAVKVLRALEEPLEFEQASAGEEGAGLWGGLLSECAGILRLHTRVQPNP